MQVELNYSIGQSVYLKTDCDQRERIITECLIRPGNVQYYLMLDIVGSWHYDFEISEEKDMVKVTNG